MSVSMFFIIAALVAFIGGAAPELQIRVNLVSLGLAFLVLAYLLR